MSNKNKIVSEVETMIAPIIDSMGMELVDVEWKQQSGNWNLCIYIDKPGGITLDDCEAVTYELSDLLDRSDLIAHQYMLEVSSPGLERPLKKKEDFERFTGNSVYIITSEPIQEQKKFKGKLKGIDEEGHIIIQKDKKAKDTKIPFEKIQQANLRYEPEGKNKKGGMK